MNRNILTFLFVMGGFSFAGLNAQESAPTDEDGIANRQEMVSEKFKRLEKVMLRMAESLRSADANRAAVLLKAISQSKESFLSSVAPQHPDKRLLRGPTSARLS